MVEAYDKPSAPFTSGENSFALTHPIASGSFIEDIVILMDLGYGSVIFKDNRAKICIMKMVVSTVKEAG